MFVSLSLFSCETSELPGGGTVTVRYILKTQVGSDPELAKHKFDISTTLLFNQPGTRGKYTLIVNPGPGLAICKVAYPHLERFWVNWTQDRLSLSDILLLSLGCFCNTNLILIHVGTTFCALHF